MRSSTLSVPALAMLALLALLASPALAQVVETAPGRFTCTAPAGQFAHAELRPFAHANAIGGRIRFIHARRHLQWPAAASLLFVLEDGRSAGVYVYARRADERTLGVSLKHPSTGNPRPFAFVPRNRLVTVSAVLDEEGFLTVSSGRSSLQSLIGKARLVRRELHC
jgi:hypothetical protein